MATARHLAAKGAKVFLGACRKERLDAIVAELERAGAQAAAMPARSVQSPGRIQPNGGQS